ncbi:hypothetical protein KBZ21_41025, partial [Streptomyces sp. A73]|nr:hypothetical protein [Streptomyces sp. A73]
MTDLNPFYCDGCPRCLHRDNPPTNGITAASLLAAYIATIPAANWLVDHYGAVPVGPGLLAPAGVYAV